jgi:hypothetical protein
VPRITRLTLIFYVVLLAFAIGTFLEAHGGLKGERDDPLFRLDPHPDDMEKFLFNRWYVDADSTVLREEPRGARLFVALNLPAYCIGSVVYQLLRLVPEFRDQTPFGFSVLSYQVLLMLLLSPLQWLLIGHLLAWFLRRLGWVSDWTSRTRTQRATSSIS